MKGKLGHIFADMQQMFQESSIHVSGFQIGHSAILRPCPKRDDRRVELPLHNHKSAYLYLFTTFIFSARSKRSHSMHSRCLPLS
jgi:hypothetical protein